MFKYTVKRLLVAIPTFFGITVLVYLISAMAPGSPLEMLMADPMATKESMEALKTQMGLNDPAIIQYFRWLAAMLQGNLGNLIPEQPSCIGTGTGKIGTHTDTYPFIHCFISSDCSTPWYHVSV